MQTLVKFSPSSPQTSTKILKNQSNANVASQSKNFQTSLNRNEFNLNSETNQLIIGMKQSMKSHLKKVLQVRVGVQLGFALKSKKRLR